MKQFGTIFKREFYSYFRSPVAYVFLVIFLLASMGCTFFLGGLYESNQASLDPFFSYLPWLFLVLVPAVGMRLWAEERRLGTIEILFTLPVTVWEAVWAKFFAGWAFIGVALLLTWPLVVTVYYLGDPDGGVMLAGYIGSFLMAGAYLAIACCASALSKNQVVGFVLGILICFILVLVGWGIFAEMLSSFLPVVAVDLISNLGFVSHFQGVMRGVIDWRDVIYFVSVITVMLLVNVAILEVKKTN